MKTLYNIRQRQRRLREQTERENESKVDASLDTRPNWCEQTILANYADDHDIWDFARLFRCYKVVLTSTYFWEEMARMAVAGFMREYQEVNYYSEECLDLFAAAFVVTKLAQKYGAKILDQWNWCLSIWNTAKELPYDESQDQYKGNLGTSTPAQQIISFMSSLCEEFEIKFYDDKGNQILPLLGCNSCNSCNDCDSDYPTEYSSEKTAA